MRLLKHNIEYIHTGPIIRKEDIFESYSLDERRRMIYTIFNFAMNVRFSTTQLPSKGKKHLTECNCPESSGKRSTKC